MWRTLLEKERKMKTDNEKTWNERTVSTLENKTRITGTGVTIRHMCQYLSRVEGPDYADGFTEFQEKSMQRGIPRFLIFKLLLQQHFLEELIKYILHLQPQNQIALLYH